jgi:serine protease AprX
MKAFLISIFAILYLLCANPLNAQDKYWVFLKDKAGVTFDPYEYFDAKAIDRRIKHNLPLSHYTDWPLNESYVLQVNTQVDSITKTTRWFNAIACYAYPDQIAKVRQLPFVKEVEAMRLHSEFTSWKEYGGLHQGEKKLLHAQTKRMGAEVFAAKGLTGKGKRIAILDAGFPGVNTGEAFKHIMKRNGIIKTYDFVKNDPFVYGQNTHGTMVLSCIAGSVAGHPMGMATDAEFLLARTEKMTSEAAREEENWLAAVEWADKNGADILNSSLGYTERRYYPENMDGKTALITRAANMAARKGILVVTSAGNDGDNSWKRIPAPADADSALSVGGINPWTGFHTRWSAFGPTADKRLKPNVAAYGHTMAYGKNGLAEVTGTSFASPLTAGYAACVWQGDSTLTNMELFKKIEESGDMYPYFDYAHGYGVPHAGNLEEESVQEPTFDFVKDSVRIKVVIKDEHFTEARAVMWNYHGNDFRTDTLKQIDRKWKSKHYTDANLSSRSSGIYTTKPGYVFYHIENKEGYLDKYYVLDVHQKEVISFKYAKFKGKILRVHYKGYTGTIELKK